jgi:glutathione S-transferase
MADQGQSVDHEGLIKDIDWHTGSPELHVYRPDSAPMELLGNAGLDPRPASLFAALAAIVLATTAVALLLVLWRQLVFSHPLPQNIPKSADWTDPIVVVDFKPLPFAPGPATGSPSSTVGKLEAMLRMFQLQYAKRIGIYGPDLAPMAGRAAYLQRGPVLIDDSFFAFQHLASSGSIPAHLMYPSDDASRGFAIALQRLCDHDLVAALLYFRWLDDQNWHVNMRLLSDGVSLHRLVRALWLRQTRNAVARRLDGQGLGKRSPSDVLTLVRVALTALDAALQSSGGPFLFGDAPCAADAAAFGVLDQMIYAGRLAPQLEACCKEFPSLSCFLDRIRCKYFGDDYKNVPWLVEEGSTWRFLNWIRWKQSKAVHHKCHASAELARFSAPPQQAGIPDKKLN